MFALLDLVGQLMKVLTVSKYGMGQNVFPVPVYEGLSE
jgi:hypothetical protein